MELLNEVKRIRVCLQLEIKKHTQNKLIAQSQCNMKDIRHANDMIKQINTVIYEDLVKDPEGTVELFLKTVQSTNADEGRQRMARDKVK